MQNPTQFESPITTANSEAEGRLKVDAGMSKKKKRLKKRLKLIINKKI